MLILPPGLQFEVHERTIHPREIETPQPPTPDRSQPVPNESALPNTTKPDVAKTALRFVSQDAGSARPDVQQDDSVNPPTLIRGQLTPRGILIQCEDLDALDRFERHLRMIAGPAQGQPMQSVVFYLKYAPIDEAARLLAELLDRTPTTAESTFGSLISGNPEVETGSVVSVSRARPDDEATTVAAGTATIISNARLNRLIVLGTDSDIALVEQYLPIIDKDTSLTDLETHGTPRIIQLLHARAEAAAAVIRDVYAGRIASSAQEKQQAARQAQSQQQRNPPNQGQRGPQNQSQPNGPVTLPNRVEEAKFTLAVDAHSNSLIVTAQKQLADEVEELALQVDKNGAQTISVISLKGGAGTKYVREALKGMLGDQLRSRPAASGPRAPAR